MSGNGKQSQRNIAYKVGRALSLTYCQVQVKVSPIGGIVSKGCHMCLHYSD